jgi:RNA polymerase sigma-70 factor (ECF subfamily)
MLKMKVESPDENLEDILFIEQTLLGNQAAFEKLVIKYHHKIFGLIASYVKNPADAEDLTQEAFLKAYQNLSSLKNRGQFPFWLRRIAKNHCTDWLRQQRKNHLSFDEMGVAEHAKMVSSISSGFSTSPEEMALKQELREIMWQAIDSLLEIDRRLLKARYLENASFKKLQAEYGLSYPAIANRLKRAKQKVRETMRKLLKGFCALPGREVLEKMMLGGVEVVKLSLKTKIVTTGIAVVLGLGGAGVWLWHSNESQPKHVAKQEMKDKAASALDTSRVQIPKPTQKVLKTQPIKSSQSSREKKISDEERKQFEQWLAKMEQSNHQSAENNDSSQDKQDETSSSAFSEESQANYQALQEMFLQMNDIREEFRAAVEESRTAGADWEYTRKNHPVETEADKRTLNMKAIEYFEKEYSFVKKIKDLNEKWVAACEQIDQIIPGALVTREVDSPGIGPRTEYSINREYIESVIGKMPVEVETIFLPVKSRTFRMVTQENLEKGRLRLERAREAARKIN